MGGTDRLVFNVFVVRTFVYSLCFVVEACLLSVLGLKISNYVFVRAVKQLFGKNIFNLTVIETKPLVLIMDFILLVALIVISSVINVFVLKRIKPIQIIKAKE